MTQMLRLALTMALIAAGGTLVGCGGSGDAPASDQQPGDATHGEMSATSDATTDAGDAMGHTASPVTVAGAVGCGHCNYHMTESCQVVVKTDAGTYVVVDGVDRNGELWNERFSGKHLEVVGAMTEAGGQEHVAMQSYTLD